MTDRRGITMSISPGQSRLSMEILNYLAQNPEAKDNLEGISEWWLLKQRIHYSVENISRAINQLVREGYLSHETIGGKDSYYRVNTSRLDEIKNIVTSLDDEIFM